MKVGDILRWELPEEPPHGTVVAPTLDWHGTKYERDANAEPYGGGWTVFISPTEAVRRVTSWRFIMYFTDNRVVVLPGGGLPAGTALTGVVPPEPPMGSVVETESSHRWTARERWAGGKRWLRIDAHGRPVVWDDPLFPETYSWLSLLYREGPTLTVVQIGDAS
ncbi:hypothetical protein GCM10029964_120740 [Kibdelosporangium lantanae]